MVADVVRSPATFLVNACQLPCAASSPHASAVVGFHVQASTVATAPWLDWRSTCGLARAARAQVRGVKGIAQQVQPRLVCFLGGPLGGFSMVEFELWTCIDSAVHGVCNVHGLGNAVACCPPPCLRWLLTSHSTSSQCAPAVLEAARTLLAERQAREERRAHMAELLEAEGLGQYIVACNRYVQDGTGSEAEALAAARAMGEAAAARAARRA